MVIIKTSGMKLSIFYFLTMTLLINFSSCKLDSEQTKSLQDKVVVEVNKVTAPGPPPAETNDFFTPSHETSLELKPREDGQFDTPIELTYEDLDGKIWKAPAGTITDGASIPSHFTSLFGGKMNKTHLFAAIIHDAYCGVSNDGQSSYQVETWKDTHHMFYNACLKNGTDKTRAGTMYAAVRLGGPRWSMNGEPVQDLSGVGKAALTKAMKDCIAWIASKRGSVSLEEIDAWMDKLEADLIAAI